jgi:hypothetical protein
VHRHNLERLMLAQPSSVDALALRIHDDNLQRDRMRQRRLQATALLRRTLPTIPCRWPVSGVQRTRLQTTTAAGLSFASALFGSKPRR